VHHPVDHDPDPQEALFRAAQGYYDLAKLLRKEAVRSETASWIFVAGPRVYFATAVAATALSTKLGKPCRVANDAADHDVGQCCNGMTTRRGRKRQRGAHEKHSDRTTDRIHRGFLRVDVNSVASDCTGTPQAFVGSIYSRGGGRPDELRE